MTVEKLVEKFGSVDKINLELKKVQSQKCRLKKQVSKTGIKDKIQNLLVYEDLLKQSRNVLRPKDKNVTDFDKDDIKKLDYDQTIRAIRSIQSKKTLTKYLGKVPGQNEEYKKACQIEKWLKDHRETLSPISETVVRKTDVKKILEVIETSDELSKEQITELLNKLI